MKLSIELCEKYILKVFKVCKINSSPFKTGFKTRSSDFKKVIFARINFMVAFFFVIVTALSFSAKAFYTELGFNFNYKKTIVDNLNNIEQQGLTGSVSLYFWDQIATEISYTNSLYVKREKADSLPSTTAQRITTQYADIYGVDLIYVFTGKKEVFQPYIKGGVAYIKKKQTSQQDNSQWETPTATGWGPSYGVGFKFFLTEAFAIRVGYDVVKTPIDSSSSADDISSRIGLSWMF